MDMQPLSPNLYRLNFQDILLARSQQRIANNPTQSQTLFADIYTAGRSGYIKPIAPQDLGEIKHSVTDLPRELELQDTTKTVQGLQQVQEQWSVDSALRYSIDNSLFKPPFSTRQKMEEEVRICKKSGLACPYTDKNHYCSALFIRCGERAQFAIPESLEQRNMPHPCLYRPEKQSEYILIIDNNPVLREFCKTSINLFLQYPLEKIVLASNGYEAIEILKKFKIESRICGLVITDAELPLMSGVEFINELYERNYNSSIALTKDQISNTSQPVNFKGMQQLVSGKTFVGTIISKPFHSATFISALKTMDSKHLFG
jgi:CheY-like chemotaxis protein